ncbi:MAG: hypothetical protein AB7K71_37375, partial [Polyangiaceae bacterium]
DRALGGAIQGARGFFTPPSVGATSCWTLRGYGRLVSGALLGAGATLYVGSGAFQTQPLAITSGWESGSVEFPLNESLGTSPFVQISITADTLDETTAADFDNIELWYHDGPCS